MDVVLEQRQTDGSWKGRKVVNASKDYKLFDEFGWLTRYPDDPDLGRIDPRGLPEGFDYSVIEEDDGEEIGHSPGWLSPIEFGQAVGRCMAKRGAVSQGFPEVIAELARLGWPEPTQARLVFWFD